MSRTINYKEKYEKALKAIAELLDKGDKEGLTIVSYRKDFEEIFPELKDEGEIIREEIIEHITLCTTSIPDRDKFIDWLEKVGKHKRWLKSIKVGDIITKTPDGILINLGQSDRALEHSDKVKPKPTWSKEDEDMIQALNVCIDASINDGMNYISFGLKSILMGKVKNWLKSIKDRVQPQNNIVTDEELIQAKKEAYNETLDKIEYHSREPTFDDGWNAAIWYLKKRNGKPQNTWKPTDGQIEALKEACDKSWEPDGLDPLYTLYKDLEKLKGE